MSEITKLFSEQKNEYLVSDERLHDIGIECLEKGKDVLRSSATRITGKIPSISCNIPYEKAIDEAYEEAFNRTKNLENAIRMAFYAKAVEIVFYAEDIEMAIKASHKYLPDKNEYVRAYPDKNKTATIRVTTQASDY